MHLFLDEMKPKYFHKYAIGKPQNFLLFLEHYPWNVLYVYVPSKQTTGVNITDIG